MTLILHAEPSSAKTPARPESAARESAACLLFSVREALYAIEVAHVRDIVQRPALAPLAQAPPHIAGVVNLRGEVVPVIDVAVRLGAAPQTPRAREHIVFVERHGRLSGLLVEAVRDVHFFEFAPVTAFVDDPLDPQSEDDAACGIAGSDTAKDESTNGAADDDAIGDDATPQPFAQQCPRCLAGVVHLDDEIVLLLNLAQLLRPDDGRSVPALREVESEPVEAAEAALLRARAAALRHPLEGYSAGLNGIGGEDGTGRGALAVASVGGEYFGIDLDIVREFCHVGAVTPVPCCPPHIVGQINLRGELLTLVDVRGLLGLPPRASKESGSSAASNGSTGNGSAPNNLAPNNLAGNGSQSRGLAVVVQAGELRVGVPVDEVLDVRRIRAEDVMPLPSATGARGEYLSGTVQWGEAVLSLLDLSKLLTRPDLVVHDEA